MNSSSLPPKNPDMPAHDSTGLRRREPDALYQESKIVARVLDPEIDLDARELRFREIYNSEELLIGEECEFQKYRILIQRVSFATRLDRVEVHKGRILRGVSADILGYLEP